jgi:hypothetical protein
MTPTQALKRYKKAPKGFRNRALVRLQDVNLAELQKRTKYGNRKCEWQGEKFDSKRELERHLVLLDMQKRGEIFDLIRQPEIRLMVRETLVCKYIGDWAYTVYNPKRRVVEDAKGFQTPEFKLKWKLAKALYPEIDWRLS